MIKKRAIFLYIIMFFLFSAVALAETNETNKTVIFNETSGEFLSDEAANFTITSTTLQNFPILQAKLSIKTDKEADCIYSYNRSSEDAEEFDKKTENLDGSFSYSSDLELDLGEYDYYVVCADNDGVLTENIHFSVGKEKTGDTQIAEEAEIQKGILEIDDDRINIGLLTGLIVLIILAGNLVFFVRKVYQMFGEKDYSNEQAEETKNDKKYQAQYKDSLSSRPVLSKSPLRKFYSSKHITKRRKRVKIPMVRRGFISFNEYLNLLKMRNMKSTFQRLKEMSGRKKR